MMRKTKLAHAVALAMTGTALSLAAVSNASAANVHYNTYGAGTPVGALKTDGWVYGNATCFGAVSCTDATNTGVNPTSFTGLPAGTLPLGYSGRGIVNWATEMAAGESVELSRANSGIDADMDIGRGAWQDTGLGNPANAQGWAHNTDIGLFRLDTAATVTFTPELTTAGHDPNAVFGITLFNGFDTGTGYTHHISWNALASAPGSYTASNPFGTTGVTYFDHNNNITSTSPWTVTLPAGDYSVYVGGVGGLLWAAQFEGYKLGIETAPVPVPAAVWLFGSALAGMGVIGRRKERKALA